MKNKKLLICGYYGFANAGDEAMLMAVIDALSNMRADLDITVLSGNPKETRERHGVKAVHRLNVLAIIKALFSSELVISGGGSLLQDVTSRRSIFYYLGVLQLAKLLRKPVMLYGQGIGPINGSWARRLTRFVCRQLDLITVRDRKSKEELANLGIDVEKVHLTADPVMAMNQVDKHIGRLILRRYNMEGAKMLVGISVRNWQGIEGFKSVLAKVADSLIKDYDARVVFMPLQYPDDIAVSEEVVALMQEKQQVAVINERCSISDFLSLVGNMSLLISVRLHALIFGAVMHVPVIGVSYDPKIDGFLEGINSTSVGDLAEVSFEQLMARVQQVVDNKSLLEEQNLCIEDLRNNALKNAQLAVELLEK